ncbi:MAG TPA: SUMF1/EgtB/PvdO family nonheme iron enzyme, partial [Thermoguttaceae bacterium]|nr:SUMF1/EgtB/PvdO family nonheme iron enzyme [Thermoguttaceae bacterium]
FYRLLTGKVPFAGESPLELAVKAATAELPPVRSVSPEVPSSVASVVEKMLSRHKENRFGTVEELVDSVHWATQVCHAELRTRQFRVMHSMATSEGPQPKPVSPSLALAPFDESTARRQQQAWAEFLGREVVISNSIGMKLTLIPPGEFLMGSPESDGKAGGDEKPQHRVRITKPFFLGVYPVTQGEYERVMGETSANQGEGKSAPVVQVKWDDGLEFCRKLSVLPQEKATGAVYRPPTEAEWEYACRAGTTADYPFGGDISALRNYAWQGEDRVYSPQSVGMKRPNAWGLFDMLGNVREWCQDWYAEEYYKVSPVDDPLGPMEWSENNDRVARGGSYHYVAAGCRSACRYHSANCWHSDIGFRVVLLVPVGLGASLTSARSEPEA